MRNTCDDEDKSCQPGETGTFNEVFKDLLITELVDYGISVSSEDDSNLIVHYKVQVIEHNSKRIRTVQPGFITTLSTGIMVLRNAPLELNKVDASGLMDLANRNTLTPSPMKYSLPVQ